MCVQFYMNIYKVPIPEKYMYMRRGDVRESLLFLFFPTKVYAIALHVYRQIF